MDVAVLGVDLAKNVFQLHGVSRSGKVVLRRRLSRERLLEHIAQLPPCLIGIEACAGAFYWQRQFAQHGHTVKIISPQYVKPFTCRSQKNDPTDAEATCTAVQQPRTRFVPPKSIEQQDVQTLHRARQRLVNHRTALVSQMRGILLDRGIVFAVGITRARTMIPRIQRDSESALTSIARETIAELWDLFQDLDDRIARFDDEIDRVFRGSESCQRIAKIKGVGPKTATAIVAAIGNGSEFKNGRHLAAWLGLVPRQHSSGDRRLMLGITKRGDKHLRTLLVHGARAVVRTAPNKHDPISRFANALRARRGFNRATIAVANKNARIIWAVLHSGEAYRSAA